jgi:hypothetical protein
MDIKTRKDLFAYTGDISQVFYAKKYIMQDGKSAGMHAVDADNGSGLAFTVLADRCLDIGRLSYKGVNFAYISKAGYAAPQFYDPDRTAVFSGGLLATCGLRNVGVPCEYRGEHFNLHGVIGSAPAEDLCVSTSFEGETPVISISGTMREAGIFGPNLFLTRHISVSYGENVIRIRDTIENRGWKKEPFMLLYHCNFGYPLLSENAEMITSCEYLRARDEHAKQGEKDRYLFQKPEGGFAEQCYYYKQKAAENGLSFGALINRRLGLGAALWADPLELPNLNVWKNPGAGDYVLGIEPGNCWPDGAAAQEKAGDLQYLKPMETRNTGISIEILEVGRMNELE